MVVVTCTLVWELLQAHPMRDHYFAVSSLSTCRTHCIYSHDVPNQSHLHKLCQLAFWYINVQKQAYASVYIYSQELMSRLHITHVL